MGNKNLAYLSLRRHQKYQLDSRTEPQRFGYFVGPRCAGFGDVVVGYGYCGLALDDTVQARANVYGLFISM